MAVGNRREECAKGAKSLITYRKTIKDFSDDRAGMIVVESFRHPHSGVFICCKQLLLPEPCQTLITIWAAVVYYRAYRQLVAECESHGLRPPSSHVIVVRDLAIDLYPASMLESNVRTEIQAVCPDQSRSCCGGYRRRTPQQRAERHCRAGARRRSVSQAGARRSVRSEYRAAGAGAQAGRQPAYFTLAPVPEYRNRLVMDLYPTKGGSGGGSMIRYWRYWKGLQQGRSGAHAAAAKRRGWRKGGARSAIVIMLILATAAKIPARSAKYKTCEKRYRAADCPQSWRHDQARAEHERVFMTRNECVYPAQGACHEGAQATRRSVRFDSR